MIGDDKGLIKKPELLAPAGSLEKLKFAVHYGADAVYVGGLQYGLRSAAGNFTLEEMREGVDFASRYGAKVFAAINIYAHNEDIPGLESFLRNLQKTGIDAAIVADPAIVEICKHAAPDLKLHLSTQQSVVNWKTVQFWKKEGIDRIVLAREANLLDIAEIKQRVDMEIEVFVHGAMCSSWSGRCVLSNHFTGRDANRGGCSQPCRWKYGLFTDGEQAGEAKALFQLSDDAFTMGAKDLCMLPHIPQLIRSGADSFKIEGRMKSIHYVATIVNAYRQAIDSFTDAPDHYVLAQQWMDEVYKAANRPLHTGFYFSQPSHLDHIYQSEDKLAGYDFAGLVLDYDEESRIAVVEQRNYFKPGQTVEFLSPDGALFKQKIDAITDEDGNQLDVARHPMQRVKLGVEQAVTPFTMMRKERD